MLKGKTELILTDTFTGSRQKIVEHNMVTNALADLFRQDGYMKDPDVLYNSIGQPLYTSVLGGILLFDTAIEEDAAKYYAPPGIGLTACGVYGVKNTVSSLLRGDYNAEESELDLGAKTMKYVYDFPTSKGNGTIASICLTSKWGGYDSYGAPTNTGTSADGQYASNLLPPVSTGRKMWAGSERAIVIDKSNDVVFTAEKNIDPENTSLCTGITIRKRSAGMKSVTLLWDMFSSRAMQEETVISTDKFSVSYYTICFDRADNCIYLIFGGNYQGVESNGTFTVYIIPLDTLKAEKHIISNTSTGKVYPANCTVYNGYIYIKSDTDSVFYKISITASGDITEIAGDSGLLGSYVNSCHIFEKNARLYVPYYVSANTYNYAVIDTEKNKITYTNCRAYAYTYSGGYCIVPIIGDEMMIYVYNEESFSGNFCLYGNYLATINNLPDAVEKTASQTMKVIYTISEG